VGNFPAIQNPPVPVPVADGGTGATTAAAGGLLPPVATSGGAGDALTGGTPTFLTWTAPNDGAIHQFNLICSLLVTSAQTGGAVTTTFTDPGGTAAAPVNFAGGLGAGETISQLSRAVKANTTVTVAQSSAQTEGAATFYGTLCAA
jgi:hypothetical protein